MYGIGGNLDPTIIAVVFCQKKARKQMITPKKIIYSGVATIVYWDDGTKTVVKRSEGTPDDRYAAFCAALAKKMYSTNSGLKRLIRKAEEYKGKVKKAEIESPLYPKYALTFDSVTDRYREIIEQSLKDPMFK